MIDEISILNRLNNQDIKAFKLLCQEYIVPLEEFAFTFLNDDNKARDIVTDFLGKMWATNAFGNVSPPIIEYFKNEVRIICSKHNASDFQNS